MLVLQPVCQALLTSDWREAQSVISWLLLRYWTWDKPLFLTHSFCMLASARAASDVAQMSLSASLCRFFKREMKSHSFSEKLLSFRAQLEQNRAWISVLIYFWWLIGNCKGKLTQESCILPWGQSHARPREVYIHPRPKFAVLAKLLEQL